MKNSIQPICQLIIVGTLLCIKNNAHAVGATVPFTEYEAENGALSGGATVVSLQLPLGNTNNGPAVNEASGAAYVSLASTGQSVTWTNNTGQNITALDFRIQIPDAPNGYGITSTIDLYVNGTFRQAVSVNSKQSYLYNNNNRDKNPADGSPSRVWDEYPFFVTGAAIAPGSTITLQKDTANSASFYNIDLVDLETPPAALSQPANSLPITSYGAVANNPSSDNTAAIQSCINVAAAQGKSVWIPAGIFYMGQSTVSGVFCTNVTIAGAGPWYSVLYSNPGNPVSGGNMIGGTSSTLQNFAMDCNSISAGCASATFMCGSNWLVNNVWFRHTSLAIWGGGDHGTVANTRVTITWSDGENMNNFAGSSTTGQYLTETNNFLRYTGDDALAVNGTDNSPYTPMHDILIANNTIVQTAGRIVDYGGSRLTISNNWCHDIFQNDGIQVGYHQQTAGITNVLVINNLVQRCGSASYGGVPGMEAGSDFSTPVDQQITFTGNTIDHPYFSGFQIQICASVTFVNNTIISPGTWGINIVSEAIGSGIIENNNVENVPSGYQPYVNDSASFTATVDGNSWQETMLIDPTIKAFSSYYNSAPYVRNVTNLVQNNFVTGEPGLSGPGYATDTHDNGEDDVWHRASGDNNPYVIFDLGTNYNLFITRIWNLNQAGSTQNGAKNVRISISGDGTTYTIIGTNTLAQGTGTTTEPAQDFLTPTSVVRYVKLEPLDGYGGGWNGLGAVRFVVKPVTPAIYAFSSYYNSPPYVRNVTNLVQNYFVSGEQGLSGPGFSNDTHDNQQDNCWHRASSDSSPYVIFDLGGTCNLSITSIWNLNQSGNTQNGAKDVRISVSTNGTAFTVLGTATLNQAGGTPTEPSQNFSTPATGIRYVKLEPLDGYGGGWNGLGAVRFQ